MQVYTRLADLGGGLAGSAVALGTFDGLHIGHQHIIRQAVALARETGGPSVVFTFSNHPLSVIDPSRCPPLIATAEHKAELIAALGVDILLAVTFDRDLLALAPAAFIALLADKLRPAHIVVGPNYSFGHRGAGTPELLARAGEQYGFTVIVPPAVAVDGVPVSSTLIRQTVLAGDVARAAALLGRPFRIGGIVAAGEGRGRGLGYPTANITPADGQVIPADGVYAAYVQAGGARYRAVANIGANPTFQGKQRRVEAHLLSFAGNLYGQAIQVDFLAKIRDEITFAGADALRAQIDRDVAAAAGYF